MKLTQAEITALEKEQQAARIASREALIDRGTKLFQNAVTGTLKKALHEGDEAADPALDNETAGVGGKAAGAEDELAEDGGSFAAES